MRVSRLVGLLFLCCLISASLSAQQATSTSSPPATSDPQAIALLNQCVKAVVGGVSVSDVTLTGTAERIAGSDDETGTATLTGMSGGYSKLSLNFPSGARTEIRNASATPLSGGLPPGAPVTVTQMSQPAGAWSGPDAVLHGMASHNVMTDATWFFPALTLANIASQNYTVSYIGQETLNGQAVVHVSASRPAAVLNGSSAAPPGPLGMSLATLLQHLNQMDIYIDPTTSLPVAFAFNAHPDGNAFVDIPVRIQFSNYQSTNGTQVPLHVQKYLNNSLILDLEFSNATLNSGLTAASFQLQ